MGTRAIGSDLLLYSRMSRRLNAAGTLRFRHWRLYGELGFARRKAQVWLSNEHITVEFGDEPLSQFAVEYQPDEKHLREIKEPHWFETQFRSPQLDLWPTGEIEWHLVKRLPDYASRRKPKAVGALVQQPLFFS